MKVSNEKATGSTTKMTSVTVRVEYDRQWPMIGVSEQNEPITTTDD